MNTKPTKPTSLRRKITIVLLLTVALLAALEIGLRVGGFQHHPPSMLQSPFVGTQMFNNDDPDTIWSIYPNIDQGQDEVFAEMNGPQPYQVKALKRARLLLTKNIYKNYRRQTNTFGMHNAEPFTAKKPPNTYRVLCLGGSTTWGISMDLNWTVLLCKNLEARLRETHPGIRVEVMNAGIPGFSSRQALIRYQRALGSIEADLVIIMSAWNDATRSAWGDDADALRHHSALARELAERKRLKQGPKEIPLLHRSRLVQLGQFLRGHYLPPTPETRVPLEAYKQNLRDLHKEVTERGGKLLICTEPSALSALDPNGPEARVYAHRGNTVERMAQYNAAAREVAHELHLPLADVAGGVRPEEIEHYFFHPELDAIHMILPGAQFLAKTIMDTLEQHPDHLRTPGYLEATAPPAPTP